MLSRFHENRASVMPIKIPIDTSERRVLLLLPGHNSDDRSQRSAVVTRQREVFVEDDGRPRPPSLCAENLVADVPFLVVAYTTLRPFVAAAAFLSQKSLHSAKPQCHIQPNNGTFYPGRFICVYPFRRTCSIGPVAIKAQRPR